MPTIVASIINSEEWDRRFWINKSRKIYILSTTSNCLGIQITWEKNEWILAETKAKERNEVYFSSIIFSWSNSGAQSPEAVISTKPAQARFRTYSIYSSMFPLGRPHTWQKKDMGRFSWLWPHDFLVKTSAISIYNFHPPRLLTSNYTPFI